MKARTTMPEYIEREAVLRAVDNGVSPALCTIIRRIPAADVVPVVRCGKDRLTKLGANGIYGLLKVKDNEQEVDSPYKNTLAAIVECFQRLAEYENAEFGMDGVEHHAD